MNNLMTIESLKESLLRSIALKSCPEKEKVKRILETPKAWGNAGVLYVFSETYDINVCVHIHNSKNKKVNYVQYNANQKNEFIHLKLENVHYTPLLPVDTLIQDMIDQIHDNDENLSRDGSKNYSKRREEPEHNSEPEEIPPKPPDKQICKDLHKKIQL